MDLKVLLEAGSFIAAISAIVISYFTYRRQKTFENENHLFKYKMEKYHQVLDILNGIFRFVEGKIDEYDLVLYDTPNDKEILETIEDELEVEMERVEMVIFANSVFLPEVVFKEIEKLMDKLFFELNYLENYKKGDYQKRLQKLQEAEDIIFDIGEIMRDDLRIDPLNIKLRNRTHERTRKNRE